MQSLETRLNVIESWKEEMQVEMVSRLLEQIATRLDMNLNMYLPTVAIIGKDLTMLETKFK